MNTDMLAVEAKIPAYVLALFPPEGGDGGDGGASGSSDGGSAGESRNDGGSGNSGAGSGNGNDGGGRQRNGRGQFVPLRAEGNDVAAYERALNDANNRLRESHDRIGELNEESKGHRTRANGLEERLTGVSAQIDASNQRVIRAEARDALRDAGAVSPRIVDLYLADLGANAKIDAKTGEPVGIREGLDAWKTANPEFFKAAAGDQGGDQGAAGGSSGVGSGGDQSGQSNGRRNSTGQRGAAGGAEGGTNTGGFPDLRNLTPKDRKQAIDNYKRGLNRH